MLAFCVVDSKLKIVTELPECDQAASYDTVSPVIFILGPTASGKTAVACELSHHIDCELISVDSTQVYRRMDIGSAKPSTCELQRYPHQLIDIREPWETYSAADFLDDVHLLIRAAQKAGRLPVLVGGTMLYFKAFVDGLAQMPAADQGIRKEIEMLAAEQSWLAVHKRLQEIDPVSAERIHPNDPQRLQRALEVFMLTGQPISQLQKSAVANRYSGMVHKFGLYPQNRASLHKMINQRFDVMLEQGLLQEVEQLRDEAQIHVDLPSQRAVGYRQAWQYQLGNCDHEEFVASGQAATRQLAKRQLTWMRSMQSLQMFDSLELSAQQIAGEIYDSINAGNL